MAHFEIGNLTFSYPDSKKETLRDVSLTVERGEYILLCGQSGSGKTTLLRHLKSVLTPHGRRSGRILFDDVPLEQISAGEQAARIGFVMQNPDEQIVTNKVWHELAFGLENLGWDPNQMRLRVAEMASFFGIRDWFHRDTAELSGGQKQLLNLASIMAMDPEVLILDEPTSQLDPIAAADFLNTVRKINLELGTTVIITEHRLEEIYHAADRVVVMERGRITADDSPGNVAKILYRNQSPMFGALPTPARVFFDVNGCGPCPLTVREGRSWLTGALDGRSGAFTAAAHEPEAAGKEIALRVKEAWFRYERNSPDILRGLSVAVPAGVIFAIVGGNGSGKSTLLKTLCGVCRPWRGSVEIFGKTLKQYRGGELFRGCVSMLPQDPVSLLVHGSVREELEEMSAHRERVMAMARQCEIEPLLDAHPGDLSGGEQQRVALAKVLLTEPKLLLLDEPTKGMDSFFKGKFASFLRRLKSEGTTVLMVSHDVEFCAEYADLVGMQFDGQLMTVDPPRHFFSRNSFYTTAASRMSRGIFRDAVTAEDVAELFRRNREVGQ